MFQMFEQRQTDMLDVYLADELTNPTVEEATK